MVSLNPNPPEGFYLDPMGMALPNLGSFTNAPASVAVATASTANTTSLSSEDPSKKVRKPYTITKSRESWTEPEHDKFLEALQLFDRDWKKIEAFVGSKTVIQIRSHAQKYFLKVQKSGANEHLPPPRPKRKAAHPYPQKASKSAPALPQVSASLQDSPSSHEHGILPRADYSNFHGNTVTGAALPCWTENAIGAGNLSPGEKGDLRWGHQLMANNYCYSSDESTPHSKTQPTGEKINQGNHGPPRVLPDFTEVYSFIGSIFDPSVTGHVQKLKRMDPIDVETVLLLMRNLSINLTSPDFEDHRRLLSSCELESGKEDENDKNDTVQDKCEDTCQYV
ncbi:protein REVEILLE 6 [Coffea arabica]|uniref:Protein REVEILLE 6 n=1 Tax=Coffea arabica TaxID=13443 RepID=A0A6P6W465_COFAR